MKLFIDTGSVAEVEEIAAWGCSRARPPTRRCLRRRRAIRATRSAASASWSTARSPARSSPTPRARWSPRAALAGLDDRVVVKVPFSAEGLAATRELASDGIPVNETLVFSAAQALLTVEAGATYVSCFMGRLDDISVNSEAVLQEIVEALGPDREAQVLAASLRSPMHAVTAARRVRGRDRAGQGAEGDAGPSAHRGGHREVRGRLEEPARVRRLAPRPRGGERDGEAVSAPARVRRRMSVLNRKELADSPLADLHQIASELGLEGYRAMRKDDLIGAILGATGGERAGEGGRRGRARGRGRGHLRGDVRGTRPRARRRALPKGLPRTPPRGRPRTSRTRSPPRRRSRSPPARRRGAGGAGGAPPARRSRGRRGRDLRRGDRHRRPGRARERQRLRARGPGRPVARRRVRLAGADPPLRAARRRRGERPGPPAAAATSAIRRSSGSRA